MSAQREASPEQPGRPAWRYGIEVSSDHANTSRSVVVPLNARTTLAVMLADYTVRYRNPNDRQRATGIIMAMFDHAEVTHPSELTDTAVLRWVNAQQDKANNTIRGYMATVRTFLGWAAKHGHCLPLDLDDANSVVRRSYPVTSGKVQDKHPARRLTYEEAFGQLTGACQDGTWRGSRDQVAIRLGLLGLRVDEVVSLRWANVTDDGHLVWMAKGRKPRTMQTGPTLRRMLASWRKHYSAEMGRPVQGYDPILVSAKSGHRQHQANRSDRLRYGHPMARDAYAALLLYRADLAGLGWVSPHDLRRTAAKLLHAAKSDDGGHLYDLHDIQKVLGHARPDTTARYIADDDTDAIDRAAHTLD